MTQDELKMVLEALDHMHIVDFPLEDLRNWNKAINAIKEALSKEKALQALHNENERLGLYKDAYAQTQEPVGYWKEHAQGMQRDYESLLADYEKLAQPEQAPVAYLCEPDENGLYGLPLTEKTCTKCFPVYRHPQRKPLTDEEMFEAIRPLYSSDKAARLTVNHSKDEYRAIEAAHGIKENT